MLPLDQRPSVPGASGVPETLGTIAERMEAMGLVYGVSGGVQIDTTVALQTLEKGVYVESPFCDHNCRTVTDGVTTGNYDCPAALSLHKGLKVNTMAPVDFLVEGISRTVQGIAIANARIVENGVLENYFRKFAIPKEAQEVIETMLSRPPKEINLFGGNPERHPEILAIVAAAKEKGWIVNLTTTGGRLMLDNKFREGFLNNPPAMLALSADDFSNSGQIKKLAAPSLEETEQLWKKTPPENGQQRKALEAIYVTKLARIDSRFSKVKVLFNLVIHHGNISFIEELIDQLRCEFPQAIVNPYPAQSSFSPVEFRPDWQQGDLPLLEQFTDKRIGEHLEKKNGVVRRLQYYLMLKAAFKTFGDDPIRLTRMLSGGGVWNCYEEPGSGRYAKIGSSTIIYQNPDMIAGGHLACFWNNVAVTDPRQVWDLEPTEIADYLLTGMKTLAKQKGNACLGCIMPRLNFDQVSVELGMTPEIVPDYLSLRKKYVGF